MIAQSLQCYTETIRSSRSFTTCKSNGIKNIFWETGRNIFVIFKNLSLLCLKVYPHFQKYTLDPFKKNDTRYNNISRGLKMFFMISRIIKISGDQIVTINNVSHWRKRFLHSDKVPFEITILIGKIKYHWRKVASIPIEA